MNNSLPNHYSAEWVFWAETYIKQLEERRDKVLILLTTSKGNVESLKAACNCVTYDIWLAEIDASIKDNEAIA